MNCDIFYNLFNGSLKNLDWDSDLWEMFVSGLKKLISIKLEKWIIIILDYNDDNNNNNNNNNNNYYSRYYYSHY